MTTKINLNVLSERQAMAQSSLVGLCLVYLSHYIKVMTPQFLYDLSDTLLDKTVQFLLIMGFRDSAKSTYGATILPIHCALFGTYKFVVIINDTKDQVKLTIANIKTELETNMRIKADFPHLSVVKTWSDTNLLLSNGTRIVGKSRGQNIRGIRHKDTRPDLIILDDPENLLQVKLKKTRDATEAWFNAEVLPARSAFGAKVIVIGNLLHNDGFIARIAKNALFTVVRIPLIDPITRRVAWVAKYPTKEAIKNKIKEVGITAWFREYLLKIISTEEQVIKEEDIHYYENELLTELDDMGNLKLRPSKAGVGNDLAIGEKETNDFTAFVKGYVVKMVKENNKMRLFVLPNPVTKRMDFDGTLTMAEAIKREMPMGTMFYTEDVGYQRVAIQQMRKRGIPVTAMRPITDKKARLETVAPWIKCGDVVFPRKGCERLIQSILGLGVEEHDDDVDALVYLILGLFNTTASGAVARIDQL